jgi:hypothetical protein
LLGPPRKLAERRINNPHRQTADSVLEGIPSITLTSYNAQLFPADSSVRS